MNSMKRFLAAMLSVLLLCSPVVSLAETEVVFESNETDEGIEIDSQEIALEDFDLDSEPITISGDIALEMDESNNLLDTDAFELKYDAGEDALPAVSDQDETEISTNDASDFEISDGVLVKYNGSGGNVVIPRGISVIGEQAFRECANLTGVVVPSGVVTIKRGAFYQCTNLVSVSLPEGLVSVEEYAFAWCSSLPSITLPSTVTTVGEAVFAQCTGLLNTSIPQGVRAISDGLFYCCSNLLSVSISNDTISIGEQAFYRCYRMTSFSIPGGVISVGANAFYGCDSLPNIAIPASVTSIGASAFSACGNLAAINVDANNGRYVSKDGVLYGRSSRELICCPGAKSNVSIASDTTSIGDWGFSFCQKLTSITIPQSVTHIGVGAFCRCVGLTGITIPEGIRSIGQVAFVGCTGFGNVTIYSTSITIANDIFQEADPVIYAYKDYDAYNWAVSQGLYVYEITPEMDPAKLSKNSVKLKVGETFALQIKNQAGRSVTWSSSNTNIATVKNGRIKGLNGGKCYVVAEFENGKKLNCRVTVSDSVKISKKSMTISAVDSATLKLSGVSGRSVTWSSSNSKVAKVVKGGATSATVKGVKKGTAVIKAKVKNGKTLKCTVKVVDPLTVNKVKLGDKGASTRKLKLMLTNQSNKRIDYLEMNIVQIDANGKQLKSPYETYRFINPIKAHGTHTGTCDVHKDTNKVRFVIKAVEFSDGTKWKP